MKCIMCLQEKDPSPEHIFPDAIGGKVIYRRVCKDCNPWLGGTVDNLLTEHFFIQWVRILHNLPGSRDTLPKPIVQGHLPSGEIVNFLYGNDGRLSGFRLKLKSIKTPSTITFTADQGEQERLRLVVNGIRREHGQLLLSPDEFEAIITHSPTAPRVLVDFDLDVTNYQRAILKIAYEVTCRWLGDSYLEDQTASAIRLAVMDHETTDWPGSHQIGGQIGPVGETTAPLNIWDEEEAHIALLVRRKNTLMCFVRIFKIFQGAVVMSTNAAAYIPFENMALVNPIGGAVRDTTYNVEINRFRERNAAPYVDTAEDEDDRDDAGD